jgi:DNA polymerase-4
MLAFGVGGTEVTAAPYVRKSRSREVTFQRNLTARADLDAGVRTLARRVAEDVVEEGRPAVRVAVKVRFAPFFTHTRSVPLPEPTSDAAAIERAALQALSRFSLNRPVRLLGVRADFPAD